MKKITYIFLFISPIIFAQSTYSSTDFAQVNDEFTVSRTSANLQSLDFAQTGANFNWDYSSLLASSQETVTWDDPNNSGYKTTWCLSNGFIVNCDSEFNNAFNVANQTTDGIEIQGFGLTNLVNHYYLSPTALENKMLGGTISVGGISVPLAVDYNAADIVYQFPINYNDTYTNTGDYEIDLNDLGIPILYATEIIRTNTVEGWGSITTPFAVFSDVLKMKTIVVQNDVITTQSGTTPSTRTTITYQWFDVNYGIPVFQVTGDEISGQFTPTSASYIDTQQCLSPTALFSYVPVQPDYDYSAEAASVSFINLSSNYDEVLWDFGDGTTSTEESPSHVFTCPGLQQITLTVTNLFCDPDLSDTIVIPISINDPDNVFTTSVTQTDTSLTADRDASGTTYQWLDCDNGLAPIVGATEQTFTPIENGNYAVLLTTNGCDSVSDCYSFSLLGVDTFGLDAQIALYPNPSKGQIYIKKAEDIMVEDIVISNAMGQTVANGLNISALSSGIYYVKLKTNKGNIVKKIIKD